MVVARLTEPGSWVLMAVMRKVSWSVALGALLSLSSAVGHAGQPWYERSSCQAAMQTVMSLELDATEQQITALERSRDLDDKACGVYLRTTQSEMLIAVHGTTDATRAHRDKHLKRMYAFAKAHAKYGQRFADLEMEARMRRVRVLFDDGDTTDAIQEARRANRALKERLKKGRTPTVDFVQGIMYSALGQSGMLTRSLLSLAGLGGDPSEGYAALKRVYRGESVYRDEALYLARHFAYDMAEDSPFGDALDLGEMLVAKYPTNGQFVFDQTRSLWMRKKCDRAVSTVTPSLERIAETPDLWAPNLRAKLFYVASRCSLKLGDVAHARTYCDSMAAQAKNDYSDRVEPLKKEVAAAERAARGG